MAEGSYQELCSSGLDFVKSLGSSGEESVNVSGDGTFNTDATDLESFSVISLHNSAQSLSSLAADDECKPDSVRAEPNETAETRSSGKVSRSVYRSYILAGGNVFKVSFAIFTCVIAHILVTGCDYWISYWYTGRMPCTHIGPRVF